MWRAHQLQAAAEHQRQVAVDRDRELLINPLKNQLANARQERPANQRTATRPGAQQFHPRPAAQQSYIGPTVQRAPPPFNPQQFRQRPGHSRPRAVSHADPTIRQWHYTQTPAGNGPQGFLQRSEQHPSNVTGQFGQAHNDGRQFRNEAAPRASGAQFRREDVPQAPTRPFNNLSPTLGSDRGFHHQSPTLAPGADPTIFGEPARTGHGPAPGPAWGPALPFHPRGDYPRGTSPLGRPQSRTSDQTDTSFQSQLFPVRGGYESRAPRPMITDDEDNGEETNYGGYNGRRIQNHRRTQEVESESGSVETVGRRNGCPLRRTRSASGSDKTVKGSSRGLAQDSPDRPGQVRPTPYTLAQAIKNGFTEDPADRTKLHQQYTTHARLPVHDLGPPRFVESRTMGNLRDGRPCQPPVYVPEKRTPELIYSGLGPVRNIARPLWLDPVLQRVCLPTLDELMDDLPIIELHCKVVPSNAGVVKIAQVPFTTLQQDVVEFLGRKAQITRQPEHSRFNAIHIIMERETGKTMDCYVEVIDDDEAAYIAYAHSIHGSRDSRLNGREVEVTYSSQDELLSAVFPRAKRTRWEGGKPIIDNTARSYVSGVVAAGFQGIVQAEEMVFVAKHADQKEIATFAEKAPTRPYESTITLLHKYPWHVPEFIPRGERDCIFDCVVKLCGSLVGQIGPAHVSKRTKYSPGEISPTVLEELVTAALVCPGFNDLQKATLLSYLDYDGYREIVDGAGIDLNIGGTHEVAPFWPFTALSKDPGADMELLKYYGSILYNASRDGPRTISDRRTHPMGRIDIGHAGNDFLNGPSLASIAKLELAKIEELFKKALSPPPSRQSPFAGGSTATGWPTARHEVYTLVQQAGDYAAAASDPPCNDFTQARDRAIQVRRDNEKPRRLLGAQHAHRGTDMALAMSAMKIDPRYGRPKGLAVSQGSANAPEGRQAGNNQAYSDQHGYVQTAPRGNNTGTLAGPPPGSHYNGIALGPHANRDYYREHVNQGNGHEPSDNSYNSAPLGPRAEQNRFRQPVPGINSAPLTGPPQANLGNARVREPLHGFHSSALAGPHPRPDLGSVRPSTERPNYPGGTFSNGTRPTNGSGHRGLQSNFQW